MSEQVVISNAARAALRAAVHAAAPNEACGALLGRCAYGEWWAVDRIEPLANEASAPECEFLISSATVRRLEREATTGNSQVVGFYHSHPQGTTPSRTDLELAWPGYLYLIADASGEDAVSGWTLAEDRAAFGPVHVQEQ